MIKIGSVIGAFNTIFLIFFTAVAGIFFARLEGFRALRSGFQQIIKNKPPIYEILVSKLKEKPTVLYLFILSSTIACKSFGIIIDFKVS